MHLSREELGGSSSSQKLLPTSSGQNDVVRMEEARKDHYIKSKKNGLSILSEKLGVGAGLGVEEYMATLNTGQEDQLQVWGYRLHRLHYLGTLLAVLVTGLLPLGLLLYWYEHLWLRCTREQCSLGEADTVLVVDHYKGLHTTRYVKKVYKSTSEEEEAASPPLRQR